MNTDIEITEAKFRPIPFWSWNDRLNPEELRRQVRLMKEAGIGGFFIHARGGLQTEYMSEEWFNAVEAVLDEAEKYGMEPWAYDENGWPSGAADGRVCMHGLSYQQKVLRFEKGEKQKPHTIINTGGYHFYYEVNPHYIDVLNPDAVARFIEYAYEPYYRRFKNRIKGFFTDEPQLAQPCVWSFELEGEYEKRYGESLLPLLPDLFFESDTCRKTRVRFWKTVCDMFSSAYFKQIYDWCDERRLMFTGHLLAEENLGCQIAPSGCVMPHYEYFHMPGIDLLGRDKERPLVPLQVGSAAAQLGKKQVLTESYALCGHGIEFDELKSIAEIQMVRGVTTICQHLEGYSMRGLRKRDYPPAMFYQQPWWNYCREFNDYISMEGKILAEGEQVCDTLLLSPQTEAWAKYDGTVNCKLKLHAERFEAAVRLLEGKHIVFHIGDETLMERHGKVAGDTLIIGKQSYKNVVLLSGCCLLESTRRLLDEFSGNGGNITSPEELSDSGIIDNPDLLYTRRRLGGRMYHFVVNGTYRTQRVVLQLDGKCGEYVFKPYESRLLSLDNIKVTGKPIETEGLWKVKHTSDNALLLDLCDYFIDGRLIERNACITDIQKRACEKERSVKVRCEFSAALNYIPKKLYLVCETPEKFQITVNGRKIDKADCGYFCDISFRKIDITRYAVQGVNKICLTADFAQSEETYKNITMAETTPSIRNKLTFDMEIEQIYLAGNFSVGEDFSINPPAEQITLQHIEKQGFPFFAGSIVLEKKLTLDSTDYCLSFDKTGINVLRWKINGKEAGTYLWQPYLGNVSKLLVKGENTVELEIVNNLRNLLGPHHSTGDEGFVGPTSFFKEQWLWKFPKSSGWHKEYTFAEMSVETVKYD